MSIFIDCKTCGARVETELKDAENPKCENCKILEGENIPALIKLLKSRRAPGQESVLKLIDLLYQKIQVLESGYPRK